MLSEVSKFQHHTNLWSKCNSLLGSSSVNVQLVGDKSLLLVERCFLHGNPDVITCTSCNICFHASQVVEILQPSTEIKCSHRQIALTGVTSIEESVLEKHVGEFFKFEEKAMLLLSFQ